MLFVTSKGSLKMANSYFLHIKSMTQDLFFIFEKNLCVTGLNKKGDG